jgi:hypothetical protein
MFAFKFARNFPTLSQPDFEDAYDIVTVQYSGSTTLWANDVNRDSKRLLFINYLVAWYLANLNPASVVGIVSDGGQPLQNKSIGGTSITYKNLPTQSGLEGLTTNVFGLEALRMYQGCPERFQLYG